MNDENTFHAFIIY